MARYSSLLGHRVEVHYRAGDILLPASGTLVADSGRSIFLEQHLMQRGQLKHFRWEIPYQYIVRLEEAPEAEAVKPADKVHAAAASPAAAEGASRETQPPRGGGPASSSGAPANSSGPSVLPLRNRAEIA